MDKQVCILPPGEWTHLPTSSQVDEDFSLYIELDTVGLRGSRCHSTRKSGIPNPNRKKEEASATDNGAYRAIHTHHMHKTNREAVKQVSALM